MGKDLHDEAIRLIALFGVSLAALLFVAPDQARSLQPTKRKEAATPEVTVVEAYYLFSKKAAVFIDVRDQREFVRERIPGAISVPSAAAAGSPGGLDLHNAATVVVYAAARPGPEVAEIVRALQSRGAQNIHILGAGWRDWRFLNLPTEKDENHT